MRANQRAPERSRSWEGYGYGCTADTGEVTAGALRLTVDVCVLRINYDNKKFYEIHIIITHGKR